MKHITSLIILLAILACVESCKMKTVQDDEEKIPIMYLDSLMPLPAFVEKQWQIGDMVAIIDSNENFKTECRIEKEDHNVCLYYAGYGRIKEYVWLSGDELKQYGSYAKPRLIKCMQHAYKVRIGSGRLAHSDWIDAGKIFSVPWQHNMQIKVADSVFIRRFGDFDSYTGTVLDTPAIAGYQFVISYDGYTGRNLVDYTDVFKIIKPAVLAEIKPGDVLYFENMYWVFVVEVRDADHIVVREEGFAGRDKIVPLKSLQILK